MKRITYILLTFIMAVCAVSCSFDESGLDSRLDAVKERIEALQSRIDEANSQVESLGLLTSGNVVTSVEKNSDGSYVLTYLDSKNESKTMVIAAMDQMINVPVIGVRKDENGLYYWTVTTGGETTDITVDGKPVPAAGKTPVISVDAQGFWTVDGERILNENGVPVEAKDGNTAIFKSIATDADGNLSVTLGNGTALTIPVQNSLNLSVSSALNLTISNLGQVLKIGYDVTGSKAEGAIVAIAEAKSVTASLDKTAKEVSVSFGSTFESGHLILMATDLDKVTVLRPVFFDKAKETKILINTAEDLMNFAKGVNAQDGTESMDVYLEKDIDMSSVKDWTPIGNATFVNASNKLTVTGPMFTGKFNGQGYKIRNFKMHSTVATKGGVFGLFGVIGPGAVVENFTFESTCSLLVEAPGIETSHGVIAGLVYDGTVRDVHSYAPMTFRSKTGVNNKAQFMSLIGYAFTENQDIIIDSVDNFGEIVAENSDGNNQGGAAAFHIAGILGFGTATVDTPHFITVSDCTNAGNMTSATCRTAGICAAANRRTKLVNCVNRGNQFNTCPGPDKGRIANIVCNVANVSSLTGCINYGDIISTSSARTGGIANLANNCEFSRCANYGKVQTDSQYRGLFWGYNNGEASWSSCVAGGTVGTYNGGEGVDDEYTDEAKENYLGKQGAKKSTLTDITYLIGTKDPELPAESNAKLKILFIGNSFTKDAVEHLPGLLAAAGIKDIKLYHMYYGGRRIFEYTNGYTTSVDYHCYRCENGATTWTDVTGHSLHEIVSSDKWDIVTIQEHTGRAVAWDWTSSQKAAVQGLVDKVKADCPEKTPDFYFIMSQAYHNMNKIATADRGQMNFTTTEEMYNVIVSMTKKLMADVPFKDVIATGTCLQNLRTSSLNNSMCLTRDGYHMDYGISRYAAACMMFEKLISPSFDNVKLDGNAYRYNVSDTSDGSYTTPVTDANAPIALQAARYALDTPYVVTDMK